MMKGTDGQVHQKITENNSRSACKNAVSDLLLVGGTNEGVILKNL
jgi:hypothetical protein